MEICSGQPWISHDIEIYVGTELQYYKCNESYIRHFILTTKIKETGKAIKLSKIASKYVLENNSEGHVSHIGEPIDEYVQILEDSEKGIKKQIKAEKPDDQVFFIKPGESEKAQKLIGHELESAKDDLWIFDSYFTDKEGIKKVLDWLRIIANCPAKLKNIVFYCKDPQKALTINELISEIEKDDVLKDMLRVKKSISVHFYQVKSAIHDRFVLIRNGNEYGGMIIGTSFNSLERNHYCISKLSHAASKIILNELTDWMKDDNIVSEEEV